MYFSQLRELLEIYLAVDEEKPQTSMSVFSPFTIAGYDFLFISTDKERNYFSFIVTSFCCLKGEYQLKLVNNLCSDLIIHDMLSASALT